MQLPTSLLQIVLGVKDLTNSVVVQSFLLSLLLTVSQLQKLLVCVSIVLVLHIKCARVRPLILVGLAKADTIRYYIWRRNHRLLPEPLPPDLPSRRREPQSTLRFHLRPSSP